MSHCTNLVVQIFSKLAIVWKIENVLQNLYAYFSHSLKGILKFAELTNIMETGGQCIFRNIKT